MIYEGEVMIPLQNTQTVVGLCLKKIDRLWNLGNMNTFKPMKNERHTQGPVSV